MDDNLIFLINGTFAIYKEGEIFFGQMHFNLLQQIMLLGSINAAAKALGISYQQAWHMIDKLNQMSGKPIIIKVEGVKGDVGRYNISPYAKKVYRFYKQKMEEFSFFIRVFNTDVESSFL